MGMEVMSVSERELLNKTESKMFTKYFFNHFNFILQAR